MRPTPSISTSAAPESMNRLNPRVSASTNESDCNFSAICPHAIGGDMTRQLSRPLVIATFLPSAVRKFFGNEMHFFSSSVCSYSPIKRPLISLFDLPLYPTAYDYIPQCSTSMSLYPQAVDSEDLS